MIWVLFHTFSALVAKPKKMLISHELIRHESSRGHKIDATKPNQTGNTFGYKQGKQTEENGQESSQQRTSLRQTKKIKNTNKIAQTVEAN